MREHSRAQWLILELEFRLGWQKSYRNTTFCGCAANRGHRLRIATLHGRFMHDQILGNAENHIAG